MLHAQCVKAAGVVGLRIQVAHVLDLELRAAGEDGRITEVRQRVRRRALRVGDDTGGGIDRPGAQTHGRRALVAVELAQPHLRRQRGRRREAVEVAEARRRRLAAVLVAGHAVVGARVQRQQRRLGHARGRGRADPRHAVVHAVVVVEVGDGQRELVAFAHAPAVGARQTRLVDRRPRAVVVGRGVHHAQAQRRTLAGAEVEVPDDALVVVVAHGHIDLVFVDQAGRLRDLVDRAASGAAPEQHRRRAAQHLDAVEEEGIPVIERRVAHAIDEHVAGRLQREAAQADVFLAAFGRQEADAGRVLQHVLHRVKVAVVDQLLGDHGDRLRHVTQLLRALADRGGHGAHAGLAAVLGILLALDGDLAQRRDLGHGLRGCRHGGLGVGKTSHAEAGGECAQGQGRGEQAASLRRRRRDRRSGAAGHGRRIQEVRRWTQGGCGSWRLLGALFLNDIHSH